jgi:hypothetical protein
MKKSRLTRAVFCFIINFCETIIKGYTTEKHKEGTKRHQKNFVKLCEYLSETLCNNYTGYTTEEHKEGTKHTE